MRGAMLGAVLLLITGCHEGPPGADEGVQQGILLLGNGAEPRTLDPHLATGTVENHVISALMEGLTNYHLTDETLAEPGVAERWKRNEDATEWTFYLRSDARWSNGDPVTARDFVYGFERMLTPALGAEYAEMLHVVKGAAAFHAGEVDDFSAVGVEAIDDHTLRISLVGPNPQFPLMVNHYSWFPVHRPTIEAHGGLLARGGEWTQVDNFVGNGPFVLAEWKPNQFIRIEKSPTYWDREIVRLNGIVFYPAQDENTELRMFQSGRLHYTYSVPTNEIAHLQRRQSEHLHIDPFMGVYFYRVNVTRPPLDDVRVREALACAIDRRLLAERVTQGNEIAASSYVPDMFPDYESPVQLEYDPERARRLLAEAGYLNGKGIPPIEILFNTMDAHRKVAEAIGAMWRETLNIEVRLLNKEWRVYLDDQTNLNFMVSRSGWIADYPDPMSFLDLYTTDNGNNNTGWSNSDYDRAIDRARRALTAEERLQLLEEAEAILMADLPVIPIYWYTRKYLKDPRLKNWFPKPLDNRPYKYIYLEND